MNLSLNFRSPTFLMYFSYRQVLWLVVVVNFTCVEAGVVRLFTRWMVCLLPMLTTTVMLLMLVPIQLKSSRLSPVLLMLNMVRQCRVLLTSLQKMVTTTTQDQSLSTVAIISLPIKMYSGISTKLTR